MYIIDKEIQKGVYIDLRRVKKFTPKTPIRIVVGPRGDGKTTSIKKWLDKEVYKNQRKFVWLCRTEDEIEVKKKDIFADVFPNWCVVGRNIYDIVNQEVVDKKGNVKTKILEQRQVGMIIPLNLSSKYRSGNSFSEYDIVIWDEFQDENEGSSRVANEMEKLFSILETILRTKTNADVWLISNEVSEQCPLFEYLKMPFMPKPNQIMVMPELKVAFYRAKTSEQLKELKKGSIISSFGSKSDYLKFAYNNEWKTSPCMSIIKPPKNLKIKFNIAYMNNIMGVYRFDYGTYISLEASKTAKTYPLSKADAIHFKLDFRGYEWFYNIAIYYIGNNTLYFDSLITKDLIVSFVGKK